MTAEPLTVIRALEGAYAPAARDSPQRGDIELEGRVLARRHALQTAAQIAEAEGVSVGRVRRMLRQARQDGRLRG